MDITPADRLFCAIPLFHTYGMGNCFTTLVRTGSALVIMEEPNPFVLNRARALELLARHGVTIFPGVPFNFRLLADLEEPADLSGPARVLLRGHGPPRVGVPGFCDRHGVAVRQLYGSTETGVMTINLDPDPVATSASVGTPARESSSTSWTTPAPGGATARRARCRQRPGRSARLRRRRSGQPQTFRDGRYFTGDLGRVDAEGRVFITGRKKLFIEVAGHKVDPLEVEDVLAAHPKVREAVVVGVKGRCEGEEIVKAAIVPLDGCEQRELHRVLPGAPVQLQGAPDRRVPRGDPQEPAREGPPQVPHPVADGSGGFQARQ